MLVLKEAAIFKEEQLDADSGGNILESRMVTICLLYTSLERKVAVPFILFVKKCCLGGCTGISFVDSTALRVCKNQRIHLHKLCLLYTSF